MYSVRYGTKTITYDILRKPSLKHTYIQVERDGVLVKTNEHTSEAEIERCVLKKSAWILRHLQSYRVSPEEGEISTGSRLYYLGKSYYVQLQKEERRDIEVRFVHSKFVIKTPRAVTQYALRKALDAFYKAKAAEKILPLVRKWSQTMEVTPTHVSFRKAKKRWGSCSSDDRLSFNYHLMRLPMPLVEYVVVHELTHIFHKNHSAEFWGMVGRHMPDYREKEERIKRFEKVL